MGAIAAALAAGAGVGQAVFGYNQAIQAKRRSQRQIYQAYDVARQQQMAAQRQGRESVTENLVGRGILSGGGQQGFARPAEAVATTPYDPRQAAYTNGVIPGGNVGGVRKAIGQGQRNLGAEATAAGLYPDALTTTRSSPSQRKSQNYADATKGGTGQANTLGGQTESDLSQQYYLSGKDLDAQRAALYAGTDAAALQGEVNAIAGGVGNAISAGSGFMGGTGGIPALPSEAMNPAIGDQIGIPSTSAVNANADHAFGVDAVNPVNPSGNVSVGSFNVLGSGASANKNATGGP